MAFWSRCKILACEVQACAESKISLNALLTSFFRFSCLTLFPFAGHVVSFFLVRKSFMCRKAFRILELEKRRGRWAVEQDFHGNFQVNVTCFFFCLFLWCPWLNWPHSVMVWKISSLCTSQWTKLSLTIKTGDVTNGRKDLDPHRWLQVA